MTNIMITGGCGFIGSNFIRYWMDRHPDDIIYNIDIITYAANPESLNDVKYKKNYNFFKCDICDREKISEIIKDNNIQTIVNFAAESHVDNSIENPFSFTKTNILGTQTLLQVAVETKVKHFHHVSTDEVYGDLGEKDPPFRLGDAYKPHSPYSASKASSDHFVRAYSHTYGLRATISHCSNNYGPYQHPEKFIPRCIISLVSGKNVPVYGNGSNVRDWIHVLDHCSAIGSILEKGPSEETTFLIGGNGGEMSNLSIVKKILRCMSLPESKIEFVKDRLGHDRRYSIDWSKTELALGWRPTKNFEFEIEKTVDWYISNRWWWRYFDEKSF